MFNTKKFLTSPCGLTPRACGSVHRCPSTSLGITYNELKIYCFAPAKRMWPEGLIASFASDVDHSCHYQFSPVGLTKIRCADDDTPRMLGSTGWKKNLYHKEREAHEGWRRDLLSSCSSSSPWLNRILLIWTGLTGSTGLTKT